MQTKNQVTSDKDPRRVSAFAQSQYYGVSTGTRKTHRTHVVIRYRKDTLLHAFARLSVVTFIIVTMQLLLHSREPVGATSNFRRDLRNVRIYVTKNSFVSDSNLRCCILHFEFKTHFIPFKE